MRLSRLCGRMFAAVRSPDLTDKRDEAETAEVCVCNDRAETLRLGILDSPDEIGGPLCLLVKTLRPFRRPGVLGLVGVVCKERVSARWPWRDDGRGVPAVMKP